MYHHVNGARYVSPREQNDFELDLTIIQRPVDKPDERSNTEKAVYRKAWQEYHPPDAQKHPTGSTASGLYA